MTATPFDFDPLSKNPPTKKSKMPWGINFGGGTNSTALVIECFNRGLKPSWILFSDTKDEKPETYEAMKRLNAWLKKRDWPTINRTEWIRQKPLEDGTMTESLEQYCLRLGYMPSAAYGYAGCSTKFKRQPAERWRKEQGFEQTVYALGYDAGEHKRVNRPRCETTDSTTEWPWYPLYAWGINRDRCVEIIKEAGLQPVAKSACWFCPFSKRQEWEALSRDHPDLFARALAIEANAIKNGNAKSGLRRSQGFIKDLPIAALDNDENDDKTPCECFETTS